MLRQILIGLASALAVVAPAAASAADDPGIAFFETKIRPVLVAHCYECHSAGAKKIEGGLLLDSRDGLRKGGDTGPAIEPGKPDQSLLIAALRYSDDSVQMPPKGKLPATVIADFEAWVKRGAPDPRDKPSNVAAVGSWDEIVRQRRGWWSLQPVRRPAIPETKRADGAADPIDRFLLTKLEERGLSPAAPADPRTFARRLSLVLTGLPPATARVEEFVRECASAAAGEGQPLPQAAVERLVDEQLASPHFGEHWARHWMDVVHFSETHGNEWNYEVHHAWRYRDYLIRAFNADVPFDQLIREHIAGDLLPRPRWNQAERFNESVIGTAFYRFGEVNHDDCIGLRQIGYDLVDNQIDTLTKAFLGMTVACARCHDHKLDAISMRDYYGLLGVLRSSRCVSHTIDASEVNEAVMSQLKEQKPAIRAELAEIWLRDAKEIERYLLAAVAKRLEQPDATALAADLDAKRLEAWVAAVSDEKSPLESIVTPWRLLTAAIGKENKPFADAWKPVADQYAREDQERTRHNAEGFTTLADFGAGAWPAWQIGGHGLRDKPSRAGEFALATDGDRAVTAILPAGAFTHRLSDRLNGTLRSPVLDTPHRQISFQALGESSSALRLVSNNCQLNYKNYRALTSNEPQWITFALPDDPAGLRVYAELMTKFDNPKFPDQLGTLGGDKRNDRVPWHEAAKDPRSHFGVARVVLHDGAPPKPELAHVRALFDASPAGSFQELAARYARRIEAAARAWKDDEATDDDVRWLDAALQRGLLSNRANATPRLESLIAGYRSVERTLSQPRIVPGLADFGPGLDQPVFVRGDCLRAGDPAPRQFVAVLSGSDARLAMTGSGRLELAERIADPQNALTARVMANRVWQHLFGTGLVRTVDDFGHAGESPSHPELLDWLAAEWSGIADFGLPIVDSESPAATHRPPSSNPQSAIRNPQSSHWSLKRLIRRIVLTRAFRMSHEPSPAAMEADPQNRLLHHYPARRMEAEAIRDSILVASGRLDRTLFGMSVPAYREKDDEYRRLFRGPLDGHGRRSLYIKCSLMETPAFLGAFNLPGGKVTQGRRDATNVPEQALALLNDPFVLQQADVWSRRVVERPDDTPAARVDAMLLAALGRAPASDERERFAGFLAELAVLHQVPGDKLLSDPRLWRDAAHTILNLREFVTIP